MPQNPATAGSPRAAQSQRPSCTAASSEKTKAGRTKTFLHPVGWSQQSKDRGHNEHFRQYRSGSAPRSIENAKLGVKGLQSIEVLHDCSQRPCSRNPSNLSTHPASRQPRGLAPMERFQVEVETGMNLSRVCNASPPILSPLKATTPPRGRLWMSGRSVGRARW